MRVSFVNNVLKIIENNEKKALLISVTGTGKTYASAFALRGMNLQRGIKLEDSLQTTY